MNATTENTQNVAPVTGRVLEDTVKKQASVTKMTQGKSKVANTARRQPLGADETAKREMEVLDNSRVRSAYTFRKDENSKDRYPITTVFDFSNCSQAEILELATASVRITLQAKLRAMGDGALNPDVYAKVDVKSDILDTTRSQVDPMTSAIRALIRATGMPETEARALVEAQLAKQSKK